MSSASTSWAVLLKRSSFTWLALCLCLLLMTGCGGKKPIVNGLDEKEANEIIVFLAGKNIDANKVPQVAASGGGAKTAKYDIVVDIDKATEAMSLLNQAGFPRRPAQNLLTIFASQSLVPSELQEKIRFEQGLAEQLASVLRKIDGVLDAEVRISFPQEDPLNPNNKQGKITASVYIKHSGVLDDPNTHLATKIRRLVAASVTGLDFDNVALIPDRARYTELPSEISGVYEAEKEFTTIWGIIIAKDSVTSFRILFSVLSFLLLLLILACIWIGWKTAPLLQKYGGLRELFHLHAIDLHKKTEADKAETSVEKKDDDKYDNGETGVT